MPQNATGVPEYRPMAIDVTTLCQRFIADHRLTADGVWKILTAKFVNSVNGSKGAQRAHTPRIRAALSC